MQSNERSTKFISSKEIGRAIKLRRMALGMSQENLAERLDVTYQQIQRYENGTNKLNVENIQTLAEVLEVPVTFFFNPENLLIADPPHPFTSDDEHELITSFRSIKHQSYKYVVINVSQMAAKIQASS